MTNDPLETEVTISDWEEEPYPKAGDFPAVSHATWKTTYSGALSGTGVVRVLLTYTDGDPEDPSSLNADYVGYEKIEATSEGRSGTLVVRLSGTHGGAGVTSDGELVPSAGTDGFADVAGRLEATPTGMTYQARFHLT